MEAGTRETHNRVERERVGQTNRGGGAGRTTGIHTRGKSERRGEKENGIWRHTHRQTQREKWGEKTTWRATALMRVGVPKLTMAHGAVSPGAGNHRVDVLL